MGCVESGSLITDYSLACRYAVQRIRLCPPYSHCSADGIEGRGKSLKKRQAGTSAATGDAGTGAAETSATGDAGTADTPPATGPAGATEAAGNGSGADAAAQPFAGRRRRRAATREPGPPDMASATDGEAAPEAPAAAGV